ncbi:MAG: outer membrane lipoprotein-sorting protein [Gammaproteobacteria bacterium]|jgi:outer membrane lipoprotein-sorting protein|nr:outer membrane lipoprotein-sorting protein [Gammaproteobacteria bacterium]MBT5223190.1 outer membrane lipoprotein-sorting protein [Gammaproteobacteria bacterium]MBT5824776.1 outer membrane lipoprotein-sorting protein [Gammaproteobacteria bacterium]MBT5966467.1 outer membrane lipoprotein-sorting protein [Gammaproteobacteria bacterium]MBT6420727.1 outer membrane lipoprotein-sorting protein [Gammaproteobacteria bacterium]
MKKIIISVLFSLLPGLVYAQDISVEPASIEPVSTEQISTTEISTEQQGFEIMQEMDARDMGWGDMNTDMQMILKNKNGDEHIRSLRLKTLEMQGDGDKSLSIFDTPRDVKGTAFLSFTHALEADEQWLYLPALKRVKRISSSNKSGPFLGSQFAFEDLTSFELKKYKYNYLRDEVVDGLDSFVVELFPQYEHSGYTRNVVWVDKERYIPLKVDYYDRKNALLKTQKFIDYKQYLEQYWRADKSEMQNHLTGKSTILLWQGYVFRTDLTERNFDKNTLKRSR